VRDAVPAHTPLRTLGFVHGALLDAPLLRSLAFDLLLPPAASGAGPRPELRQLSLLGVSLDPRRAARRGPGQSSAGTCRFGPFIWTLRCFTRPGARWSAAAYGATPTCDGWRWAPTILGRILSGTWRGPMRRCATCRSEAIGSPPSFLVRWRVFGAYLRRNRRIRKALRQWEPANLPPVLSQRGASRARASEGPSDVAGPPIASREPQGAVRARRTRRRRRRSGEHPKPDSQRTTLPRQKQNDDDGVDGADHQEATVPLRSGVSEANERSERAPQNGNMGNISTQ
jgi:hypothetical protein